MPVICAPCEAEYFFFLGLTQFLKIRSDLPGGLFCRSPDARLQLRAARSRFVNRVYKRQSGIISRVDTTADYIFD